MTVYLENNAENQIVLASNNAQKGDFKGRSVIKVDSSYTNQKDLIGGCSNCGGYLSGLEFLLIPIFGAIATAVTTGAAALYTREIGPTLKTFGICVTLVALLFGKALMNVVSDNTSKDDKKSTKDVENK